MYKTHRSQGLTLVEILVVLAIVAVLGSIVTVALSRYARVRAVEGVARSIVSELHDARSRTLAARSGVSHGVHLASSSVTLFEGSEYDADGVLNEVTMFDSRTTISAFVLSGGGDDIVFERLSGETNNAGTITVSAVSDLSVSTIVTIGQTGLIAID